MSEKIVGNEFRCDIDIIVDSFSTIDLSAITETPIIAVYDKPIDYPGKYVARLFGVSNGTPASYRQIMIKDTLEEIRAGIPLNMIKIPPALGDDPKILEVYL